ncbi:MAG TPA: SRPBCC domain-containing protein [Bacteroidia bacterium]|nr:SRPBCC domain-containing protein [Bacteroidia bacterium]
MKTKDFTSSFLVSQTASAAFEAINNVRGWWSEEIEGSTDHADAVFNYHYEDVHSCAIKIIEMIPAKKITWLVMDNYFKFTKDKSEWKNTRIIFDISEQGNKTLVQFTHQGLVPEYECYEICRDAWTTYIQKSLQNLISNGIGNPNGKDKPQTENEKKLAGS